MRITEIDDFVTMSPATASSPSKSSGSSRQPDLILEIEGMMCQKNCASTVRDAIQSVKGVENSIVTFATRNAEIWLTNLTLDISEIVDMIECVGYDVVNRIDNRKVTDNTNGHSEKSLLQNSSGKADITLIVKGMDNVKDLVRVEEILLTVDGVTSVEIFASKQVVDIYGYADTDIVINMLKQKGYTAMLPSSLSSSTDMNGSSTTNPLHNTTTSTSSKKGNNKTIERIKASMKLDLKQLRIKHDVNKVMESLANLPGIDCEIDMSRNQLIITYNDMKMSQQQVIDILSEKQLGPYLLKQQPMTITKDSDESNRGTKREFIYHIRGMSCGACAVKIEKALKTMPGVIDSAVSVMTHQGRAVIDDSIPDACGPRDLMEKVITLGYECKLASSNDNNHGNNDTGYDSEVNQWKRMLIISLIFGIPVLIIHFGGHLSEIFMMLLMKPALCGNGIQLGQLLMFLLNLPILIFVGYKFYKSAIMGAMNGLFGMDFLVMTGSSITFIYSLIELFFACRSGIATQHIFFETTGMLLMFVTIGKFIEAYAKGKSASSIAELLKLQPTEVRHSLYTLLY